MCVCICGKISKIIVILLFPNKYNLANWPDMRVRKIIFVKIDVQYLDRYIQYFIKIILERLPQ